MSDINTNEEENDIDMNKEENKKWMLDRWGEGMNLMFNTSISYDQDTLRQLTWLGSLAIPGWTFLALWMLKEGISLSEIIEISWMPFLSLVLYVAAFIITAISQGHLYSIMGRVWPLKESSRREINEKLIKVKKVYNAIIYPIVLLTFPIYGYFLYKIYGLLVILICMGCST